mmetsp:Transcript_134072/g.286670  ORF Transcript_134072/g.286670 Transcript_134072/m.286670 type:complete len:159 (-) Transcript_134072:8-484(-)
MGSSCSAALSESIRHLQSSGIIEDDSATGSLSAKLLEAARRGDAERARACLLEGASADHADSDGWAPLHYGASAGHAEVCRLLLEFQADANAALPDLSTPLMLAVEEAHIHVAKLLLEGGALAKCKDEDGFTAATRCDKSVQDEFRRLTSALESEPAG